MTTLSVGLPTWNRSAKLRACLASILGQDFHDFHVHVFDNGSTDDTEAVVRSFRDERIVFHLSPENVGRWRNMSRLFRLEGYEFSTLLFDDEELLPGSLRARVEFLRAHPTAALVHSGFLFRDESGKILDEHRSLYHFRQHAVVDGPTVLEESFRENTQGWICSVMMRAPLFSGIQIEERCAPSDDDYFFLQAFSLGDVGYIDTPLVTSTSSTVGESVRDGYLEVRGGRRFPTLYACYGHWKARLEYLARSEMPASRRRHLRQLADACLHRNLAGQAVGRIARRPRSDGAIRVVRDTVALWPSAWWSPQFYRELVRSLAYAKWRDG